MSEESDFLDQYGIKPELQRKAMETIEWLTLAVGRGAITEAQFSTGVDVLFMAVSGLVKEDVMALITAADTLAKQATHVVKRCFVKDALAVAVWREVGGTEVVVTSYLGGQASGDRSSVRASVAAARDDMNAIAVKMLASGYQEL